MLCLYVNVCKYGQSLKNYKRVNMGTEKGGRKKKDIRKEEKSLGVYIGE